MELESTMPTLQKDLVGKVIVRAETHDLSKGAVRGVQATEERFPDLFEEGDRERTVWLGARLRYDTRDSPANPYGGGMLGLSAETAPWLPKDGPAATFKAEGTYAAALPPLFHRGGDSREENPPTDVFVVAGFTEWTAGEVPFYQKPSLGGRDTLRGYIGNRWTGDAAWHASAEYRFWLVPRGFALTPVIRVERIGAALFYDVGTVAGNLAALRKATVRDSKGLSLRLGFDRTTLFRFDYGFSAEGHALTVAYGLSF
jgi:outer membrane protein assembly factor BamA